jgi:hypothetical protein
MDPVSSPEDARRPESSCSVLDWNDLILRRSGTRHELAYEITYWIEHTDNRRGQRELGRLQLNGERHLGARWLCPGSN